MKVCPFCAEQIQDAAIVCRFCNRPLPTSPTATIPAEPSKRRGFSSRDQRWLIGTGLLLILGWFALASIGRQSAPAPAASTPATPTITPEGERAAQTFSVTDYDAALRKVEGLLLKGKWEAARQPLQALRTRMNPISRSSIATRPDIVALTARLEQSSDVMEKYFKAKDAAASAVDAGKLFAAFDANEIRANEAFKGKRLKVRGTIERIGTDILNTPYVALATENVILSVQAMFPRGAEPQLAALHIGQMVIVDCRCDGKFGNVILRECSLVQ